MNNATATLIRPSRPMLALLSDRQAATPEHIATAKALECCRKRLDPRGLGPMVTYFAGARERFSL